MFSVQAKLLVPDTEAEAAEVCRVKSVEDLRPVADGSSRGAIVEPGASMAIVADLWEFIGSPGDDARKVSATGMMQKIIHPVLSTMPNPGRPGASLSALERARMDDEAIAI